MGTTANNVLTTTESIPLELEKRYKMRGFVVHLIRILQGN